MMLQRYEKIWRIQKDIVNLHTMRRILFLLLAVLWMGTPVSAKGKKAPKSPLKSFSYQVGGGMEISHQDEVTLRLMRDGKRQLTLRGDCYYERITFEVGEDVFLRVDSMIHASKLYQSKGFYEWKMRLLDAPSTSFSVTYTDYDESFSGGGDMPHEIWDGMGEIVNYLKSLRGDRQAPGHLTTHYISPSEIPDFRTTVWTDGIIEWTPDEEGISELTRHLNRRYGFDDKSAWWVTRYVEGCGMRCLILSYNSERLMDVFVDKSTRDVTLEGVDTSSTNWPQAYQRLLVKGDLKGMPTDSLLLLEKEIGKRYDPFSKAMNDLERQNSELILRYTERLNKDR